MRTGHFVEGLSNAAQLMAAIARAENRAAPEKSWVLVEGDVGYGKSKCTLRTAVMKDAAFVRAKAGWTPRWALADLAGVLSVQPFHRTEDLLRAITIELMQRPKMIFVDEIDHAARTERVLETLRDVTDQTECILVAIGMKGARGLMKRYPQIFSRVTEIVTFGPASVDDVKLMCAELTEVKIADGLAERIQKATGGRLREVMDCIARVEAFGRKARGTVTVEAFGDRPLLTEDRKTAHG
jgi:hypothetical protein